jgi:hypothetical protein
MKYIFHIITALIILGGCKKEDTLLFNPDFKVLKVYYDTAISGDNPAFNMAAGKDRIFMTYGYKYFFQFANGGSDYTNLQPVVMATNNDGSFLWRNVLPEAFEECAVAALDDGGCIVASQIGFGNNPLYLKNSIYLFRFNASGEMMNTDSVSLAPYIIYPESHNNYINTITTREGKIIFYGDFFGRDPGFTSGFAFEYSPSNGLVWFKQYELPVNGKADHDILLQGCIQTDDNALMFCGSKLYFDGIDVYNRGFVLKTTLTGDTLWSKYFGGGSSYLKGAIVKSSGGYRIAFNIPYGSLIEINKDGDSIRSVQFDKNFISTLLRTDDGGCIALINNSAYSNFNADINAKYFQSNTHKVVFDADLNVISDAPFQTQATDFLPVSCRTATGDYAFFGLMQSIGKTYYLPHLYLLK